MRYAISCCTSLRGQLAFQSDLVNIRDFNDCCHTHLPRCLLFACSVLGCIRCMWWWNNPSRDTRDGFSTAKAAVGVWVRSEKRIAQYSIGLCPSLICSSNDLRIRWTGHVACEVVSLPAVMTQCNRKHISLHICFLLHPMLETCSQII